MSVYGRSLINLNNRISQHLNKLRELDNDERARVHAQEYKDILARSCAIRNDFEKIIEQTEKGLKEIEEQIEALKNFFK